MGVFRWVLRALGVVAVLVGMAGLVIGRAGVVWSPVTQNLAPSGQAVTTSPALTAYSGVVLAVEATVHSGSVLVGAAHPVDVQSWLGGATSTEITAAGPGGVETRVLVGDRLTPPVAAAAARFWSVSASGARREILRVPLDGTPIQVVVASSEVEQVDIRVGLVTPALRPLSVGLLLVGVALVVGSFVTRRRTDAPPGSDAVTARGTLLAVLLLPLLGGCGVVPQRAEGWTAGEVTKPALTIAEAPALFEDYDRRNNAAMIATAKSGDPKAWATVDAEVVLDQSQFSTHLDTLREDEEAHGAMTHTADRVWAPEFGGYPMYAVTSSTLAVAGEKTPDPDQRRFTLWLRADATDPWRAAGFASAITEQPQAVPTGESATPTESDRALALDGAEAIMAYLRTADPGKVSADPALSELATGSGSGGGPNNKVTIGWWNPGAEEQVAVDGSVRAVRVSDGILAHASLLGRQSFSVSQNETLSWNDPAYAKAVGQPGKRRELSRAVGVSVFYLVAPDQTVRVLATDWDAVR